MNAYEGSEKYIFVSYAHKDRARVLPILEELNAHGCRIWCDEKLIVGENYNAAIARHLENCDAVLFFLSENWMQSDYCRSEATVGIEHFRKKAALLYLEPCAMHYDVMMLFAGKHTIRSSDPEYLHKLLHSPALCDCIEAESAPKEADDHLQELLALANTPEGREMLAALLGKSTTFAATSDSEPDTKPAQKATRTSTASATRKKATKKQTETKSPPPALNPLSILLLSPEEALEVETKANKISEFLCANKIRFSEINASRGPTVTQYKITPAPSQNITSLQKLTDQLELVLSAERIRFTTEPSSGSVIYEVPNETRKPIKFYERIASPEFSSDQYILPVCLGADHSDCTVVIDLAKMPHLMIGGVTGTGKSTCLHTIILSLIEQKSADELRLILIDPKSVEFSVYRDLPHLELPIITDPRQAGAVLESVVKEVEERYVLLQRCGVRDITGYRKLASELPDLPKMPYTVIVIDELADLMLVDRQTVENAILRLAQKARAAGIHLVLCTQRPSPDVITGMLKTNVPSRIAFRTVSPMDSRTLLDASGAERLCGSGDMLFLPIGRTAPTRIQGAFVSNAEIQDAVQNLLRSFELSSEDPDIIAGLSSKAARFLKAREGLIDEIKENPRLLTAMEIAVARSTLSAALLQRQLQIGYSRAAVILDTLEAFKIIGPYNGAGARKVLISEEDLNIIRQAVEQS